MRKSSVSIAEAIMELAKIIENDPVPVNDYYDDEDIEVEDLDTEGDAEGAFMRTYKKNSGCTSCGMRRSSKRRKAAKAFGIKLEDFAVLPSPTEIFDQDDVDTVMVADWYEVDGIIIADYHELDGLSDIEPEDVGIDIYAEADNIMPVPDRNKRFDERDGFYSA